MNILIIDDTDLHLQAARETLSGHNITCVSSYDEATLYLDRRPTYEEIESELPRRGIKPWTCQENRLHYNNVRQQIEDDLLKTKYIQFDVILCDLLMPAGKEMQATNEHVGQMMPVGFALAMRAVLHGAKYVAVVTATNHHNHPASAMLDKLGNEYWGNYTYPVADAERQESSIKENFPKFIINGARVGFYHHPHYAPKGTNSESKHWGMVLQALLQDPPTTT